MQAEVDELLTIAGSSLGRLSLVGLASPWATASSEQIQSALRGMRDSSLALRQQAFVTALRQCISLLAGQAVIEGVILDAADSPLVQ